MYRSAVLFILGGALALPAGAQQRPSLPSDKDANDWEAYYNLGVEQLGHSSRNAEAAFIWASHLRPDRPEPLYGQWIAFWSRDIGKFEQYLRDDDRLLNDPQIVRVESLRRQALRRNPFVHQGLIVFLWDQLPGQWRDDPLTRGWIYLGQAKLPEALARFGDVERRDPEKYGYLRFLRASAFVNLRRFDSAAAEISALLTQERAQDAKSLGNGYESKELLEYALGLLQLNMKETAAAREAFGRATVENASFAPAHAMLGEIAAAARDTATVLLEYGLAAETDPTDVEILLGYGKVLRLAHRPADAVVQLRRATALEPYYAEPYFHLGLALEDIGDKTAAAAAYTQFLSRSTQWDPRRQVAEQKRQPGTR